MVSCGLKGLIASSLLVRNACRTESVVATMSASGEAAAIRPFVEDMLSSVAVEGGRLAVAQPVGRRRIFLSPSMPTNPNFYKHRQHRYRRRSKAAYLCGDLLKLCALTRLGLLACTQRERHLGLERARPTEFSRDAAASFFLL